jgi:hypothetical protein
MLVWWFVLAALPIVGLFAFLPTVVYLLLALVGGYHIRRLNPASIACVALFYFAIPIYIWMEAAAAIEDAEQAYQAEIDALPSAALPDDLPLMLLVRSSRTPSQQEFASLRCKELPQENRDTGYASRQLPQAKLPLPTRYLLLDLAPKVPLPRPTRSYLAQDNDGPFMLRLVDRGNTTVIRYHWTVRFKKLTAVPILSFWGWSFQFDKSTDTSKRLPNAVDFIHKILGRCVQLDIYASEA